jgi:ATP-dependent RNA helicase RhlE
LTPTRELAAQILANIKEYKILDLKSTVIFGGVNQNPQVTQLRQGIDILVPLVD